MRVRTALGRSVELLEDRTVPSVAQFVDPHPSAGNDFGAAVVPLSTGNVVVTAPMDDAGAADGGAVYLFNGATGALISTLIGTHAGDHIGDGGVTALTNGNFVIASPDWHNGTVSGAGAVTWGKGTTGVAGPVSATNSLVGTTANDSIGKVAALTNGNYVVYSSVWDNGAATNAGAVTWGSGTTGVAGPVSAANSLVGTTANDNVALNGITALTNGNYVVASPFWHNGAAVSAGATTWGSGTTGVAGPVSAANSLIGTTAGDLVGSTITALTNGNYVVASPDWDNGAVANVGAATWGNGATGLTGPVTAANSLIGSATGDLVG
ncbi:MAG TPA: hypothetical protein VH092_02545, partial [Urbifossiella sp.]|nr:hypothetical protein [Urbifossiella sp.]